MRGFSCNYEDTPEFFSLFFVFYLESFKLTENLRQQLSSISLKSKVCCTLSVMQHSSGVSDQAKSLNQIIKTS